MKQGFRQSMAWLHTWSGLILCWLLFAIFLTGTASYFRQEIQLWMQPELHASRPDALTAQRAYDALQARAPQAQSWNIVLPGPRSPVAQVSWRDAGAPVRRGPGNGMVLDAGTGAQLSPRESNAGNFLYRFHFELYGMERITGRWIVGVATVIMLIGIITGIVTHRRIFKDFFTLRPRKGHRSWLDGHNAAAVLALPFHLMITYSGLLLLMTLLMPWGIEAAYQGDTQAFFSEWGRRGGAAESAPLAPREPAPGATPLSAMLAHADIAWGPGQVASISVTRPGTAQAIVELRRRGTGSLLDRGQPDRLRFRGADGQTLPAEASAEPSGPGMVYNVLTALHLVRFADPVVRWIFFLLGLMGTFMAASGLVLWVVKREPDRRKLGRTPAGHRLVQVLNVAAVAGMTAAVGALFWANRLIPAGLPGRAQWEIHAFFAVWGLSLLHAAVRPHRAAWREQLWLGAALFALAPLLNAWTGTSHLLGALRHGDGLLAGIDLTLLALGLTLAAVARKVGLHRPPPAPAARARPPRAAPRPAPGGAHTGTATPAAAAGRGADA